MRRDFSVRRIYADPLKGMGVPIGEVEPNATSTDSERGNGVELVGGLSNGEFFFRYCF